MTIKKKNSKRSNKNKKTTAKKDSKNILPLGRSKKELRKFFGDDSKRWSRAKAIGDLWKYNDPNC